MEEPTQDNVIPLDAAKAPIAMDPAQPSVVLLKEQAVRNFALVHALLAEGVFPGRLSMNLTHARQFIEQIHANSLTDFEKDPEYSTTETARGKTEKKPS